MENGRVTKNTAYLTAAYIFQKLLAIVYFAYLARTLGADVTGKYIFSISFVTLFVVFIDWGLGPLLTREVAKEKAKSKYYLANIFSLKLILSFVVYGLIVLTINLIKVPAIIRQTVYLAAIMTILDCLAYTVYSVFRGHQNLKYESLGIVFHKIIAVSIGVTLLSLGIGLPYVILPLVIASLFYLIYAFVSLRRVLAINFFFSLDKRLLGLLLKMALPFAIAGIFFQIHQDINSVLLGRLASDTSLGWFGAANKIPFSLRLLPAAFAAALYPAFSQYFISSKEKLAKALERSIFYLLVIVLPLLLGALVLSDKIILLLYGGEYAPSALVLQILMVGLIFTFLDFPLSTILNACNKQIINTINRGIAVLVNVVLCFILIPTLTHVGAAMAYTISFFLLFVFGWYWANRITFYNKKYLGQKFLKIVLSSLAMAGILFVLKNMLSVLILIPLGLVLYLIFVLLTRTLSWQEAKEIVKVINPRR